MKKIIILATIVVGLCFTAIIGIHIVKTYSEKEEFGELLKYTGGGFIGGLIIGDR